MKKSFFLLLMGIIIGTLLSLTAAVFIAEVSTVRNKTTVLYWFTIFMSINIVIHTGIFGSIRGYNKALGKSLGLRDFPSGKQQVLQVCNDLKVLTTDFEKKTIHVRINNSTPRWFEFPRNETCFGNLQYKNAKWCEMRTDGKIWFMDESGITPQESAMVEQEAAT